MPHTADWKLFGKILTVETPEFEPAVNEEKAEEDVEKITDDIRAQQINVDRIDRFGDISATKTRAATKTAASGTICSPTPRR